MCCSSASSFASWATLQVEGRPQAVVTQAGTQAIVDAGSAVTMQSIHMQGSQAGLGSIHMQGSQSVLDSAKSGSLSRQESGASVQSPFKPANGTAAGES